MAVIIPPPFVNDCCIFIVQEAAQFYNMQFIVPIRAVSRYTLTEKHIQHILSKEV